MSNVSLSVIQQAIVHLFNNSLDTSLSIAPLKPAENEAIEDAKRYLNLQSPQVGVLKLIFDLVKLRENQDDSQNNDQYYVPLKEITCESDAHPSIPYPIANQPSQESLTEYQERIIEEIKSHLTLENPKTIENWQDIDFLLFVLEKYASCLSYGDSYTALVDATRMTAAVAEALARNAQALAENKISKSTQALLEEKIYLVAGSLSGIQDFIYTISSDGALKSLRARSFYLELVAEEIVRRLLEELQLPRTSVIYAGGGKLFLLAGGSGYKLKQKLEALQNSFNIWLFNKFQGKIFFALDCASCNVEDIGSARFRNCWDEAIDNLAKQKSQKFINQIGDVLKIKPSHQPCKVCHRDDVQNLKPLNKREPESSPPACKTCRSMFKLGDKLPKTLVILRTKSFTSSASEGAKHDLGINGSYYYLFENVKNALLLRINPDTDTIYAINNWKVEDYAQGQVLPILMGRYYKRATQDDNSTQGDKFITAEELAEVADGINRVGYLRMDVDRLGQIFAKGLNDQQYSLPRIASLSRQMSYFFKVYLNSLASDRFHNLPSGVKTLTTPIDEKDENSVDKKGGKFSRKNLMFIYAGGDDLFISGAWNEITEFALDIYQSFRAYSGNNPDITISGGISIEGAKFPLYQAADSSGESEKKAKGNGRDSLGLFGNAFKWEEWLGAMKIQVEDITSLEKSFEYIGTEEKLELFGVLPITQAILNLLKSEAQASRSFTRNLLATAQVQEQKIQEIEDGYKVKQYDTEKEDIRYFLHLPKIAYTLARLPSQVQSHDSFSKISQSLKSPYNAPYFRAIATWIELLNRTN